jgi:hypothetical protein
VGSRQKSCYNCTGTKKALLNNRIGMKDGLGMPMIDVPAAALSWLGRQGTRALAALVLTGIALPMVGAVLKPYLTAAVFVLLCIAFIRVDMAGFRACVRQPALALSATVWTSIAVPGLFGLGSLALGFNRQAPDLFLAMMLQAIASPMMAAPALAALMGLDATLVLVTLISSTALIPITAPLFAHLFVGGGLSISPVMLAAKLFAIIAGAAAVGFGIRRIFGLASIERQKERIDGLNILVLFVFVVVLMKDVGTRFLRTPIAAIAMTALAFLVFFIVFVVTVLLFLPAGRERAVALGFMVSQRNMGLMLAATGGALPGLTWLYFALSQFPIYLSPYLLRPLIRKVLHRVRQEGAPVGDAKV